MARRTKKQKLAAQKRKSRSVPERKRVMSEGKVLGDSFYFKADLTKSLWLTMLAVGVEIALWYLWR